MSEPQNEIQINEKYVPSPIMKYFSFSHLPLSLHLPAASIAEVAGLMDRHLPNGPEKSAGLRKLLEAKDCFVRSLLP